MQNGPSFLFPHSEVIPRKDPCSFCRLDQGNLAGQVDYFGLAQSNMVQCPGCGLVSIDPIPESEVVAEGCRRLYLHQQPAETRAKRIRGFAKSFRRGALFARKHLSAERKAEKPIRILEVGAGDGYFSAGIKTEIPRAKIFLLDIVEDLARFYKKHHDCETIVGEFSSDALKGETFDFIIFRDLLEHVRNPFEFLCEVNRALKPQGQIFFITPNGREDFWMINQRFAKSGDRSVLLLNHFHYFLPDTLQKMIQESGFATKNGFKFGLKHFKRGMGWKEFSSFEKQTVPEIQQAAPETLEELWDHEPSEVRGRPLSNLGVLSKVYSAITDVESQRTGFFDPKGHEFFVIAEKQASPRAH